MVFLLKLLFLIVPICAYVDEVVDYTNYVVLTAIPISDEQVQTLRTLEVEQGVSLKMDVWNTIHVNNMVNIGVPSDHVDELRQILSQHNIMNFVKERNLQDAIDEEKKENTPQYFPFAKAAGFAVDQYHQYPEIVSYLKSLEVEHPDLVKTQVLGKTVENRDIMSIRIGLNSNAQKPVILIDAGIHAREWIAPATALFIITELVSKQSTDSSIKDLLEKFDWHFIPVANPDGYVYTWTSNRMWRKNRSPSFTGCYGADPNRNFELGFGGEMTSTNPCADIYTGPSPFSEAESRAIKLLTETHKDNVRAMLTLHAFGQMWMSPWGYTNKRPSDYNAMVSASKKATDSLTSVYGTRYKHGSIYEVIYPTGGGSTDWQYQVTKCPYAYAVELRDNGVYGFQLPKALIVPTATETWTGIKTLAGIV